MHSIRSRFTFLIATAIIISIAAIGGISTYTIMTYGDQASDELLNLTCETRQQSLDSYLNSIEQSVMTVSNYATEEMTGYSDEEMDVYLDKVDRLFRSVANNTNGVMTYYYRISPEVSLTHPGFWYSKYGSTDFSGLEMTDILKYDEDDDTHVGWFYQPKESGRPMWLEPYENENLDGVKMISFVAPVFWQNRFIGVVGIDLNYETFRRQLEYIVSFDKGYAFLVNADDKIIYHDTIPTGTPVSEVSEDLMGKRLSAARPITHFEYDGVRQRSSWSVLSNGMRLYVAAPEDEIDDNWLTLVRNMLIATVLILVVFLIIGVLFIDRIIRPLDNLTEAAVKIDAGDYNVELDYSGRDEVGILTAAFRQLVSHLKLYINDLNDMAYKDALTSLRNKGAFDMFMLKLDDRVQAAPEGRKPEFAVCMFDCNNLKYSNDTYGHDKGDVYLKTACSLICDVFRHSPVFRLGGDEFVSILQKDDYARRTELCKEFDLRSYRITEEADEPWKEINVAGGIAIFDPLTDKNANAVVKRADKMMYEDKERKKSGILSTLLTEEEIRGSVQSPDAETAGE